MELGEKLRQARLEAGLTQRQLCGEEITRNMLSQIEHGSARPSMKTLQYLAGKLGKSVSFFLDETAVVSPNQQIMDSARRLYDRRSWGETLLILGSYRTPDPVYDREYGLLLSLSLLNLAEESLRQGKERYALELLEKIPEETAYCPDEIRRRRTLLQGRIQGLADCTQLPSLDEELLLRAQDALSRKDHSRCAHFLEAAENHSLPRWQFLRGETYLAERNFSQAAACYLAAETTYPKETIPKLELCYRELKDYKKAYEYACKQKR